VLQFPVGGGGISLISSQLSPSQPSHLLLTVHHFILFFGRFQCVHKAIGFTAQLIATLLSYAESGTGLRGCRIWDWCYGRGLFIFGGIVKQRIFVGNRVALRVSLVYGACAGMHCTQPGSKPKLNR